MTPTSSLLAAVAGAIANDTSALAQATFVHVYLVKSPFVPGINLTVADLTKADFAGAGSKATTVAAAQAFQDPATNEWIIQVNEPVSGWHWQTTDGTTNLPQTIYGYALTNTGETTLWGTALLDTPALLNAAGQGIDVAQVRFRLSNAALS